MVGRIKGHIDSSEPSELLLDSAPFLYSLIIYPATALLYCSIEITPYSLSLQDAFIALEKHTFLSFLLKCFIASSAIIIALNRSIVADKQIKLQSSSNNISNFYSIQDHIKKDIESNFKNTIKIIEYTIIPETIFEKLFTNPSIGNYDPSLVISNNIDSFNLSLKIIHDEFLKILEVLESSLIDNEKLITGKSLNCQLRSSVNSMRLNCSKSKTANLHLDIALKEINNLSELYINLLKITGLKQYGALTTGNAFDEIETTIKIRSYISSLIAKLPIDIDSKQKFFTLCHLDDIHKLKIHFDEIDTIVNSK
jgi:hypothetical protein